MTRLSIQSRNEKQSISIHLGPGQSCTIGSGVAADFCLSDPSVQAIHCRIQLVPSGGYIECLNPDSTILVNQKTKNRSRLVNGDFLKIGDVMLDVVMPEANTPPPEFHINFEDEEPDSTLGDQLSLDGMEFDALEYPNPSDIRPDFSNEDSETEDLMSSSVISFDDLDEIDSHKKVFKFDIAESDEDDQPSQPDSEASEPQPATSPEQPSKSEPEASKAPPEDQSASAEKPTSERPQFSFDSTDSEDVELSETEIKEVYDDDPASVFPTMNISMTDDVDTDSESVSVSLDHDVDLTLLDASFEQQGEVVPGELSGGSNAGKFWRWSGSGLQPAIESLLDNKSRLNLFSCRGVQTQALPTRVLRNEEYRQMSDTILLISELTVQELQEAIRNQRWDDRMGTPMALRMFLDYAPAQILNTFFSTINAVVLVEGHDSAMLRLNRKL